MATTNQLPSFDTFSPQNLYYEEEAEEWQDSLPVGNGRLGAMIYGRPDIELLQLNENSVWYGGPQNRVSKTAGSQLDELRRLIREGRHKEAEKLVEMDFLSSPRSMRHYEPLATSWIDFGHKTVNKYRRGLDLATGSVLVSYVDAETDVEYTRRVIASHPDQVVAYSIDASKPQSLSFSVRLSRVSDKPYETNEFMDSLTGVDNNTLVMKFTPGGTDSNRGACIVRVTAKGGTVKVRGGNIVVDSADTACVYFAAHTVFRTSDPAKRALSEATAAATKGFEALFSAHIDDFGALFGRMSLHLGENTAAMPTPSRLERYRLGKRDQDPDLLATYVQFARYLMISCSRNGGPEPLLPSTLQGLWNPWFQPPWGAKYTININTEMNYWLAHTGNLSECEDPLFSLLERVAERGSETAMAMYGCRGWVVHHNTDIWADTAPQDAWMPATIWVLAGAWLCIHVYENFLFTRNKALLERLHSVVEGSVQFYLDFLIENDEGRLVTSPSVSPENTYILADGTHGTLCEGPTIDSQILITLFDAFAKLSDTLGKASSLVQEAQQAVKKLPPMCIGSQGQLLEWSTEYKEAEPGHRHTSHLWGLYPGTLISPDKTPDLAAAARTSLVQRAKHGGGHTGWSRAWLISLWARLLDGEQALEHATRLLADSTMPNLLDVHPPFQIDGNFGGAAGILEMLIQSHGDYIFLLPAASGALSSGKVRGLCARGGFELSFSWKDGVIQSPIRLKSKFGQHCTLQLPGKLVPFVLYARLQTLDSPENTTRFSFATYAGAEHLVFTM